MTKKSNLNYGVLILAFAAFDALTINANAADASVDQNRNLEEIVVTADKRSERLLDVPNPVSVVSGDRLETLQVTSLVDLANYVPGLAIMSSGQPGLTQIVIRGLSSSATSSGSPLVATYIDDFAVSNSNSSTGNNFGFDLNPYDIDHVEVLKGPQGTLYGADSMGGLIKYVLRKPDLTNVEMSVGGAGQFIDHSGGASGQGRAYWNLPIVEGQLALRVSAFYRSDDGYIDNVTLGTRNTNNLTEDGVRATLLWKPLEALSLQATMLTQDVSSDDSTTVTVDASTMKPLFGDFAKSQYFAQPYTQHLRNYMLSLDWDLGFATLTDGVSYSTLQSRLNEDLSHAFGPFLDLLIKSNQYPDALVNFLVDRQYSKTTEELRLASPENQALRWMIGGMYTKEVAHDAGTIPYYTSSYVPLPYNLEYNTSSTTYKESAAFANTSYKITNQIEIGAGYRYASNTNDACTLTNGGLLQGPPGPCLVQPRQGVSTWMGTASYHLTDASMLYARVATGYRPGGVNCSPSSCLPGVVPTYDPDRDTDYDIGFKGAFLDNRLSVDIAVFNIDWKDVQVQVPNGGVPYIGNGGGAKSKGAEFSSLYHVTNDIALNATLGYTDAHLTHPITAAGGQVGDALPNVPRWTSSIGIDYRREVTASAALLAGGSYRYRDWTATQFAGAGLGGVQAQPVQNIANLYLGAELNRFTLKLYGTNVFNNYSYNGAYFTGSVQYASFIPAQPRTIGISADYRF